MCKIIMRNWDIRKLHVRDNLPSTIQQVRVSIRRIITLIQGLPNPIRQVLRLISHSCSYPPHLSHFHPPSLSFSSTTLTLLQNAKLSYPSLSLHVMIMSWHQVQHTPSTAYTEYSIHRVQHTPTTQNCLTSLHSHDNELTPECSFSFRHAPPYNWLPSASFPWELKGKVTLSHSHCWELTNRWIGSHHLVRGPLTASK